MYGSVAFLLLLFTISLHVLLQELKAIGHIASKAGTPFTCTFVFIKARTPVNVVMLHSGWPFPLQLNMSENIFTEMI